MVCDVGEKYFAPTLVVVLALTGRVANRYAVLLVAIGVKNILVVHLVAHLAAVR